MGFMEQAIIEARKAMEQGEVPVGAVIVKDGAIIGRGYNLKERKNDITAHAEIIAIREASKNTNNWRLSGCSMYVTLEPCAMCASAIAQSRISHLYIGTADVDSGACGSVVNMVQNDYLGYWIDINWSYDKECSEIISKFFKARR